MELENWQYMFYSKILSRGWNYYNDGSVENLHRIGHKIHAVVLGSEEYEVSIELTGGAVSEMYCTCPFAEGGECCKHMAAVLYAIDAESDFPQTDDACPSEMHISQAADYRSVVAELSDEKLRCLLLELCAESPAVRRKIQGLIPPQVTPGTIRKLEKKIDSITKNAQDRYAFIDYENAYNYASKLMQILDEEIAPMIPRNWMDAFSLTCYVFQTMSEQDMDDSDGGSREVLECCQELWKKQIAAASVPQQMQMYAQLLSVSDQDNLFSEEVESFCFDAFTSHELMSRSLSRIDARIQALKEKPSDSSYTEYLLGELIRWRLTLMNRLGVPKEETAAFRNLHYHLRTVREAYIEQLLSEGMIEEAISVIRDCMDRDSDNKVLCAAYSNKLLELYQSIGDSQNYVQELMQHVLAYPQYSLERVHKLKELLTPEQWHEFLPQLITQSSVASILNSILFEEQMYDTLLYRLEQNGHTPDCLRFLSTLQQEYPSRTAKCLSDILQREMDLARGPKDYRRIAEYLTNLQRIPSGQALANALALSWRQKWPRRRSLLEALSQIGL